MRIKDVLITKNGEAGFILPMGLILLVVASLIIVPGLYAMQNFMNINSNVEQGTLAYYAADAGVTDAKFNFQTGNVPSSVGLWRTLPNQVNGMTVKLTLLYKVTESDGTTQDYFLQSNALSGSTTLATINFLIKQGTTGTAGNNLFEQAAAALQGNITMSGGAKIISDDTSGSNYGNIYANGNVTVSPSAIVGGSSCPAKGIASATGTVTVNTSGGACVGTKVPGAVPISYTLTISNFTAPADAGTNYTSQAASWASGGPRTYYIGPGYVDGPVSIGGNNTIILTGNLHVRTKGTEKGTFTVAGSALVKGTYTIVADDKVSISGGSTTQLVAGEIPFIITQSTDSTRAFYNNSVAVAAVIYAPNGGATISGGCPTPPGYNVYGSVIAKRVTISGSAVIKYLTGIHSETQIPGAGQGGTTTTTTLGGYDYQ